MNQPLRVLSVASEMVPFVKTGGLADVTGALPNALAVCGVDMRSLLPGYPSVMRSLQGARACSTWSDFFGGTARLLAATVGNLPADPALFVLDAPHLYDRPGNPYLDPSGKDWPDNAQRFAALALSATRIAWGEVPEFLPDLLHLHDWQAALAPVYLHFLGQGRRSAKTLLTLHNLAFQGQFKAEVWNRLGLPQEAFAMAGLEYHGDIGFLKAGIHFADAITTVSATYRQEICTPQHGMGLDAMLRWRGADLSGIVNGIDTDVWNPATDPHLAHTYNERDLRPRSLNKQALEERYRLAASNGPLICMISRLTAQKGIDIVVQSLAAMVESGARLIILGTGDAALEAALVAGAARYSHHIAVQIGYDDALSHQLQGGCDAILVPSRFEPCGLTQLYGLRYGCVPIVSRVGGLADTVIDANDAAVRAGVATGIQFAEVSESGLIHAIHRAVVLYQQPKVWQRMQHAGMTAAVGWEDAAAQYAGLYRRVCGLSQTIPTGSVASH